MRCQHLPIDIKPIILTKRFRKSVTVWRKYQFCNALKSKGWFFNKRKLSMSFWIRTIPSLIEEDKNTGWKTYMLLKNASCFLENLSCHFAMLSEGKTPHPIHRHTEEKLFIIFSGTFEILTTEGYPSQRKKIARLKRGSVIYLPAHCPHTIRSFGPRPTS